jgi:AraC family transcriptional regulator
MAYEGSQSRLADSTGGTHRASVHRADVVRPSERSRTAHDDPTYRPQIERAWVSPVIALLDAAISQLQPGQQQAAHRTLRQATSLLRALLDSDPAAEAAGPSGRLLAWQARRVRDHIDSHIATRLPVAELSALVRLSEAHFSRAFRRTFGESPHSFVLRRRVALAAHYMLHSDAPLSDIALRCGFVDQAHLCRRFRQATGQTPSIWRRALRTQNTQRSLSPDGLPATP